MNPTPTHVRQPGSPFRSSPSVIRRSFANLWLIPSEKAGRKSLRLLSLLTGGFLLLGYVSAGTNTAAQSLSEAGGTGIDQFLDLSLEELMNLTVITVSKRPEALRRSPSAIHVITGDQIRQSGATSIPESLRMAPGVHVGRVDSSTWAISTRGFSEVFANKQLVMIDGRSVYTPLFAGVFWEVTDTFMEDIDRIEVIRGPGASIWGANAVNGVINVITKHSRETQGGLIYAGSGTHERGFTGVRHGGELGEHGHFRVYGKHFQRDNLVNPDGSDANDRWYVNRGGFRADIEPDGPTSFTLHGDVYDGATNDIVSEVQPDPNMPGQYITVRAPGTTMLYGGHLLGQITYSGLTDSQLDLQAYYDYSVHASRIFREERHTFDTEIKHHWDIADRHRITSGLGYRVTADRMDNSFTLQFHPEHKTQHLYSAFAQDEIALVHDRLYWTLGSKIEHNDATGFEVQPGTRLLWLPTERQAVWAAVSRALRTPARADRNVRANSEQSGALVSIFGNDSLRAEEMIGYELGYRVQPEDRLTLDFALFYNEYNRLVALDNEGFQMDPNDPHVRIVGVNASEGETYGGEVAASWQAGEWWRWRASYSLLRMALRSDPGVDDPRAALAEGRSPRHQISLHSTLDLPDGWQFSTGARYVDNLPADGIGSYSQADARLAWRPGRGNVEFSVVGQNLLRSQHTEAAGDFGGASSEVERSFYGRVEWMF